MTGIRASVLISVLMVALAVLVATGGTVPALAQADEVYKPHKQMWAAKRANVRAGPSTSHEKVGLLEVGDRADVVARTGDWFKLYHRAGQLRRFVYAPLLSEVKPSASRPAVSQSAASTATVKTINYSDGDRYRGQIRNGKRHGRGVYTWADGGSYDGEWLDGDFHGRGVRIFANGNRYEGDYVKDKRTGRGVFRWPDGSRYEGDFVKDKRTGHGVFRWPSGNRWEGEWRNGDRTEGLSITKDGEIYIEKWRDGQRLSSRKQAGAAKEEQFSHRGCRGRIVFLRDTAEDCMDGGSLSCEDLYADYVLELYSFLAENCNSAETRELLSLADELTQDHMETAALSRRNQQRIDQVLQQIISGLSNRNSQGATVRQGDQGSSSRGSNEYGSTRTNRSYWCPNGGRRVNRTSCVTIVNGTANYKGPRNAARKVENNCSVVMLFGWCATDSGQNSCASDAKPGEFILVVPNGNITGFERDDDFGGRPIKWWAWSCDD